MTVSYNLNKDFIEEVRASADIVRTIERHVPLRQRGQNFIGLCPFHDEKTPSFNVNRDRQMYYCFGCGAGGDVFKFLMEHENMSFVDAVVELAKEANLKIPLRTKGQEAAETEKTALVEANEAALAWYTEQLHSEQYDFAQKYLEDRGIDRKAQNEFQLGFAPDSYDALQKSLSGKVDADILEKTGLIQPSSTGSGKIDRFRKRIIFPIRSAGGRLVAFGGRIYGDGEPKFLNSPETPIFHKSNTLFGLNNAIRTIRKSGFAILVEGYFDVIVLQMAGLMNTVAPLGTSFTEGQARLLSRYTGKTIICMDADEAGQRASIRSAGILLEAGFAVNIIPLPPGEDPDSFIRKHNGEAFRKLLKSSEPAYTYVMKVTAAEHDVHRPSGQRSALTALLPLLNRIGDPIERSHAICETANVLGVEQHLITVELQRLNASQNKAASSSSTPTEWLPLAEKELLQCAVNEPEECQRAIKELNILEYLTSFTRDLLTEVLNTRKSGNQISLDTLTHVARDDKEMRAIAELTVGDYRIQKANALECAKAIAIDGLKKEITILNKKISEHGSNESAVNNIDELFEKKMEITFRIKELEQKFAINTPPI